MAIKVKNKEDMANVATIAANNDREIGNLLADAMDKVGKDGVITVDEGKSLHTSKSGSKGCSRSRLPVALLRHRFPVDGMRARRRLHLGLRKEDLSIRIMGHISLLEQLFRRQAVVVVRLLKSIDAEALATLVINRLRGTFTCCAVKAPGYGDRRKA